jgi:2-polyprenyl-3-methyl-5-hydroxy-6-metoxy-1,4-benzoquinol methylase
MNEIITSSCKICRSNKAEIIAEKDRHGKPLTTVICTGCGFVHHHPIPSPEDLEAYYTQHYRRDYKQTHQPKPKHILRYGRYALERWGRIKPYYQQGMKVLDIGSGSGEFVYLLRQLGVEASGLEPSDDYSRYCHESLGIPIIKSVFEKAEIAQGEYQILTLHHVLEHLHTPLTALSRFNQWLALGGYLVIDVPNLMKNDRDPQHRFHYAHIYNFSPKTLCAVAQKAGFSLAQGQKADSTALVFIKTGEPTPEILLPNVEHYQEMRELLTQRKATKYYKSSSPYAKFLGKALKYGAEQWILLRYNTPKQILNSLSSNPAQ